MPVFGFDFYSILVTIRRSANAEIAQYRAIDPAEFCMVDIVEKGHVQRGFRIDSIFIFLSVFASLVPVSPPYFVM